MDLLSFDGRILSNFEIFVLNKFYFYSNATGIDFLSRGVSAFSNKPFFYQVDLYSLINPKVFTFSIKFESNDKFVLSIKCGSIRLKNGKVLRPINKKVKTSLFVRIDNFKINEFEDDILFFSVITLPKLLFSNYKVSESRTLYDEWVDLKNKLLAENTEAKKQVQIEKLNKLLGEVVF